MAISSVDRQYMSRALQLAKRGRYATRPNPCVGCLLVDEVKQQVIADAWHHRAGEAHAEINALRIASDRAKDKTLYVTLEPCSHHGKTGPCVKAIIAAGIRRVVYAMKDPNPRVSGAGLAMLQAAGIRVDGPLLESQARTLNRGFVRRMETERPFVCCKLAMSIDGRTAMADGQSQWITGSNARSDVQRLRALSCAVITGVGSILQDNSRLTVRSNDLIQNSAPLLRVIVDSQLRTPVDAAIFSDTGTVIIATSETSASSKAAEILQRQWQQQLVIEPIAVDSAGHVDLDALLHRLATTYHCNQVLVEAGATLSGAFLQRGLLDEIILYMAPILIGSNARPLFNLPLSSLHEKQSLVITDQRAIGQDWRVTVCPQRAKRL